jgi:hypothetical protein
LLEVTRLYNDRLKADKESDIPKMTNKLESIDHKLRSFDERTKRTSTMSRQNAIHPTDTAPFIRAAIGEEFAKR